MNLPPFPHQNNSQNQALKVALYSSLLWSILPTIATQALPPPEDTPEEILRTEIIIEGRSPIDGQPLTPAEYAELQEQLQTQPPPNVPPQFKNLIFLLRIRRMIRTILPF